MQNFRKRSYAYKSASLRNNLIDILKRILIVGYNDMISVYELLGRAGAKIDNGCSRLLCATLRNTTSMKNSNPFFCRRDEVSMLLSLLNGRDSASAHVLQGPQSVGKSKIIFEVLDKFYLQERNSANGCDNIILISEGSHALSSSFAVVLELVNQIFGPKEEPLTTATSANDLSKLSCFKRVVSGIAI